MEKNHKELFEPKVSRTSEVEASLPFCGLAGLQLGEGDDEVEMSSLVADLRHSHSNEGSVGGAGVLVRVVSGKNGFDAGFVFRTGWNVGGGLRFCVGNSLNFSSLVVIAPNDEDDSEQG